MISQKPNNIDEKNSLIQDNINSINKSNNPAFLPLYQEIFNQSLSQNSNPNLPLLTNNYIKNYTMLQSKLVQITDNFSIQKENLLSNIQMNTNNMNNTTNSFVEDDSFEKNKIKKDVRINQVTSKNNNNENNQIKKRKNFNKFKISHIEYQKIQSDKSVSINRKKHKRKYKPDDIRKKIKARFHKSIKNIINENLRKAGSRKVFTFLPQTFVSSISREKNKEIFNLSLRELLQMNFVNDNEEEKKYQNKRVDLAKYQKNVKVLEYLDKHPDICQNSGFDIISKMKYSELLEEYFHSDEFQRAIIKLREENEDEDYIREYIHRAKTYIKFFENMPTNKGKRTTNDDSK